MLTTLTIVRYPPGLGWAGFLSMALFRLPLAVKAPPFWKLLGCGKNGTFSIWPDWRQWGVIMVHDASTNDGSSRLYPGFMEWWWRFFRCRRQQFLLEPVAAHGTWDGQRCFGELPRQAEQTGQIAVLTRATIRRSKLRAFWSHVDTVSRRMQQAAGYRYSVGIGETPWFRQATFSIWESAEAMKSFAYGSPEHADVIRKTRKDDWYSEEMFVRFRVVASEGWPAEKPLSPEKS